MISDSELLYMYRQGCEEAFEMLYHRYIKMIYKLLKQKTSGIHHSSFEKEECLQECLFSFYDAIDSFCETKNAKFSSYVYSNIVHAIAKYREKVFRFDKLESSHSDLLMLSQYYYKNVYHLNPDRQIEMNERISDIDDVVGNTKGLEKKVAIYLIRGLNTKEIKEALGYHDRQVDNALYRVRKKLRIILQKFD